MASAQEQQQPLISCIIIFFNEEKYLREAIESVLAQTYSNWELLLIDDGSRDHSGAIARHYCAIEPRVRYLTHAGAANRGMSASRNLGLYHTRGQLVAFLDGDDTWFTDKLERQVALFMRHTGAVMVCGATVYWHSWQVGDQHVDRIVYVGEEINRGKNVLVEQDRLYQPKQLMTLLYPLGNGATPSSSGHMFRRDMAVSVGGFDETFRGLFEDQVFRAKAYLSGPIYVSSEVFDRYRQHDESCSNETRAAKQTYHAKRRFLIWLRGYLKQVGCRDSMIRFKLERALVRAKWRSAHEAWTKLRIFLARDVRAKGSDR